MDKAGNCFSQKKAKIGSNLFRQLSQLIFAFSILVDPSSSKNSTLAPPCKQMPLFQKR
jgi:hypothetical protein